MFANPRDGVYHTPINCYRASGWQDTERDAVRPGGLRLLDVSRQRVDVDPGRTGERLIVVYWYQLGEHVLFDRWDLGMKVRWALRGRPKWPALIKVMLQISAPDVNEASP